MAVEYITSENGINLTHKCGHKFASVERILYD